MSGDCHTGTGTSRDVLKLETRVWRMHTQVLHALNRPKQSSGAGGDRYDFLSKCCTYVAQVKRRVKRAHIHGEE